MPEEKCRAIQRKLDITPSDEKKFMLWSLLKEYRQECLEYANSHEDDRGGDVARLTAQKASDIEELLCYELW